MNACDYGHETRIETRRLPTGGDGAVIICHGHYFTEMHFRRERIAAGVPFDLPEWESLNVYGEAVNA